jgi:hypothetical protein
MKKHCKFNSTFRQNVVRVAETLGLEFISTPKQVENGTLSFYDPQGKCTYSLYESGYVRRSYYNEYALFSHTNVYQLNPIEKTKNRYNSFTSKRILMNPNEQLGILVKSVINWRSYEN